MNSEILKFRLCYLFSVLQLIALILMYLSINNMINFILWLGFFISSIIGGMITLIYELYITSKYNIK